MRLSAALLVRCLTFGSAATSPTTSPLVHAGSGPGSRGVLGRGSKDCAANSDSMTDMTMRDWDIWHAPSARAHLKGSFTIFNPGPEDEYRLRAIPFVEDGDWYDCVAGTEPLPKTFVGCQYSLNMTYNELGFKFKWVCDSGGNKA